MGTTPDRLPPGPLTYEDYCELPDDGKQYEILGGELHVSPAPVPGHQMVSANLQWLLTRHIRRRGLGLLLNAPIDLILATTTVAQPDIIFIATGRESIITHRAIESPPDLLVEVLSPATSRKDRTIKADLYARFGVPRYWIVDPAERTFEMFELAGTSYRLVAKESGDAIVRPALFPGLEIPLAEVWA